MLVDTTKGIRSKKQDSWVTKNEVLTDLDAENAHVVKRGSKVGVDDVPANTEDTAVLGNPIWERITLITGIPTTFAQGTRKAAEDIELYNKQNPEPSDEIKLRLGTGSATRSTIVARDRQKKNAVGTQQEFLKLALLDLAYLHQKEADLYNGKIFANNGKNLPGFKWGGNDQLGNIITSGMGVTMGVGLYLNALKQPINNPNIYAPNQYESQALTTLAGLRDNPYNQLRAMQDAESRNRYATNQSGGLTGAQKYLANVASGIGLQKNYADILNRSNQLNNQYRAQWANAALQVGTQNALRQQAANQYRDEAYARSHAARNQMMMTGMQNVLAQTQQYYANEFKRRQFERMMDLYWAEHNAKYPSKNNNTNTQQKKFVPKNDYFIPPSLQSLTLPGNANALTANEWKKIIGVPNNYRH